MVFIRPIGDGWNWKPGCEQWHQIFQILFVKNMIFRQGNHPNIPHMANISSSAQVICWLLSHFFGDISSIPVLTACDIRIGISRIDYPHTIPCRKHHLANSSQNGWSAIKPYHTCWNQPLKPPIHHVPVLALRPCLTTFLRSCAIYWSTKLLHPTVHWNKSNHMEK